ncbi:MAG: hypothetical protein IKJ60_06760 [Ruminococcus sp.]|nr:hypothetical protein [Ruminococcus sp.]
MKRYIFSAAAVILAALSAVSCNSNKNTADYVTEKSFTVFTDTTYPQVPADSIDKANEVTKLGKLRYALNGPKVELYHGDTLSKILEFYYTPSPENFSVDDFNFDGYEDIFVPFESPADYGTYYCYNPEKRDFEENAVLNSIGRIMKVTDEGNLQEDKSDEYTERYVEYQWSEGKLKPVKKTESFKSDENGEIITNVYGYDPMGNEFLAG